MNVRDESRPDRRTANPRVRLEPMSEEDLSESVKRSVSRYAAELVKRGISSEEGSLEFSRHDFDQFLPQGLKTPNHHLFNVIDASSNARVGETWYTVQERGGKIQFWIDWIWIEPPHRRHGFATAALRHLEDEARKLGADRTGLSVWMDNPGAVALYTNLGYVTSMMRMSKRLDHANDSGRQ